MAIISSFLRTKAILNKEIIEMRRDYLTYISMILFPILQTLFFGYVINTDPRHLPTIVLDNDKSSFSKSIINGFKNTTYFDIKGVASSEAEAEKLLKSNSVDFVINIPLNFAHDLIRELHPHILLEADATDPIAIAGASQTANKIVPTVLHHDLRGSLEYLNPEKNSFVLDLHAKYNASFLATYHSLPGLLAIFLTTILVTLTGVSMSSEYELGTFETLLTTPARPIDIILGKIIPHVVIGYAVFFLLNWMSYVIFNVPFIGSFVLLTLITAPFILANLGMGLILSVKAKTQIEAAIYTNFYIIPAIFISGFVFPFHGMPPFAQFIGSLLPTTHYLNIMYNIKLKGSNFFEVWPDLWPILLFLAIVILLCVFFYRKTLD